MQYYVLAPFIHIHVGNFHFLYLILLSLSLPHTNTCIIGEKYWMEKAGEKRGKNMGF